MAGGLRVLSTPGHTPGHLSFYAPAQGWLIAGDSLNATRGVLKFVEAPVNLGFLRSGCNRCASKPRSSPRSSAAGMDRCWKVRPFRPRAGWPYTPLTMSISKDVAIIGVPVDLGAGRRGVDMGPSAVRYCGVAREAGRFSAMA